MIGRTAGFDHRQEEVRILSRTQIIFMAKEKMYLVRREVMAKNIREAMYKTGKIYSIELAEEKFQPEDQKSVGFDRNQTKSQK